MLRVSLQVDPDAENAPPEALLDKLETAFVELGGQLLEPLRKAHKHHGEVDVLEEMYEGMARDYEERLRSLKKALLAEYKEG